MSKTYHDYQCPKCGHIARDHIVEIQVGAIAGAPECPECLPEIVYMEWIPQVGRMDAGGGPTFQPFETFDGQNKKVVVRSLGDLRRLERESEQQYKNGEGQPLVFRNWSQDGSNKDVNTLDRFRGGEQPSAEGKHKFGPTMKKTVEEPDTSYGPGVSDANTSALGKPE